MEQAAQGDQVLASKPLLERLSEEHASAPRLDPERVAYRALAEIEGVSEKAKLLATALRAVQRTSATAIDPASRVRGSRRRADQRVARRAIPAWVLGHRATRGHIRGRSAAAAGG
jgi:hypothetical protein